VFQGEKHMPKCPDTPSSSAESDAAEPLVDNHAQIAFKLKALYSQIEQEPIPDIFLDLLERLDSAEKAAKG
jgi:Anti-sigma factor NepR